MFQTFNSLQVEVIVVKDHDDEDDMGDNNMAHPVPARAPPPNFKPSVPPMAAGYPMMGGPRFGKSNWIFFLIDFCAK